MLQCQGHDRVWSGQAPDGSRAILAARQQPPVVVTPANIVDDTLVTWQEAKVESVHDAEVMVIHDMEAATDSIALVDN